MAQLYFPWHSFFSNICNNGIGYVARKGNFSVYRGLKEKMNGEKPTNLYDIFLNLQNLSVGLPNHISCLFIEITTSAKKYLILA